MDRIIEGRGLHGLGAIGRPTYRTDPHVDPPELFPPPGHVVVVGKSPLIFWTDPVRQDFHRLTTLAKKFGLSVQDVDGAHERPRNRWSWARVDLSYVRDTILEFPGVTLDDLAWDPFMKGHPFIAPEYKAARNRASVAVSRLIQNAEVERRSWPGEPIRHWGFGRAPKPGEVADLSKAVPPGVPKTVPW